MSVLGFEIASERVEFLVGSAVLVAIGMLSLCWLRGNKSGLRGQAKWSPTYITTSDAGYWCDPFWGGCWVVGNDHYLHEFDVSGGIILRF